MTPRFFIDSADPRIWETYLNRGWVYGATTNPLILKREGREYGFSTFRELVDAAQSLDLQELHIQATGTTVEALVASAEQIAALSDRVVVKVPLTTVGLEAATRLSVDRIPLTLTACYAAHQMIPALMLDVAYIAAYYGRLIEAGEDGTEIVERMRQMRTHVDGRTRILIASLRTVEQVELLMSLGHDTFTLAPAIADAIARSPMSDEAAAAFEAAARGE